MKKSIFILLLIAFCQNTSAQFTLNGNAVTDSCNGYTLTPETINQTGSVWNNTKIDLSQYFDFLFNINLGQLDNSGGDGIAFVLQPISSTVINGGGGIGCENITPSVAITIDTHQDAGTNDPAEDHIAIQLNGDIDHNSPNNIAGPVSAINGNADIEDANWHTLRIVWDPFSNALIVDVDGSNRVFVFKDIVTDVFSGNPLVFWGFTGSTGNTINKQRFRTALNPAFYFSAGQVRCYGTPITFYDSTISYNPVVKMYWDFGDGSPVDSVNVNPVHTFAVAGDYFVKQRIIDTKGCEATNIKTVRVGSKPVPGFKTINFCVHEEIYFTDTSSVLVGTVNNWYWDLGNGVYSTLQNPNTTYYPNAGNKNIRLAVKTLEGCLSDTLEKTILIITRINADFTFTDSVCLGSPTYFFDQSTAQGYPIEYWRWRFSDSPDSFIIQNPVHIFSQPGNNSAFLVAAPGSSYGTCLGVSVQTVFVVDKPHAAIKNQSICQFVPVVLQDSSFTTDGVAINSHWWELGNGQFSTQQNPQVTYNNTGPVIVRHVVTNVKGCISDTIVKTFFVNVAPVVSMNFTDGCKNKPVNFSGLDNSGLVTQWSWSFGDGATANTKDAQHVYTATGTYSIKLYAVASTGCYSDSLQRDIIIYSTNAFAGIDTSVAAGQPVQLHATGGTGYLWSPVTGLSNPDIADPIVITNTTRTYTVKAFTLAGCETFDDVIVKISGVADIYLPNAFTPNGDGLNDVFRGTMVGLREFKFMKIFNRFGQEIFYTTDAQKGWDGTWKGKQQNSAVYVVIASGIDYRGLAIDKKATVMLIR